MGCQQRPLPAQLAHPSKLQSTSQLSRWRHAECARLMAATPFAGKNVEVCFTEVKTDMVTVAVIG